MSKESERRERVERRRIAREKGICARCFDKPTTLNQDGATKSIYCDGCRPARKMRVNERDVQTPRKIYDEENVYSRFDEPDAQRYFAKVGLLLRQRPVTIREINETYPPPFGVTAYDAIEKTNDVLTDAKYVSRYWVENRRKDQQRKFNGAIEPPSDKMPDRDSQFRERRI